MGGVRRGSRSRPSGRDTTNDAPVWQALAADLQRCRRHRETFASGAALEVIAQARRVNASSADVRVRRHRAVSQQAPGGSEDGAAAPPRGSRARWCRRSRTSSRRRGAGSRSSVQARSASFTKNGLLSKSISGFGVAEVEAGRDARVLEREHRLDQPAAPAAASRWPTFALHRADGAGAAAAPLVARTPASARRSRSDRRAACPSRAPRRSRSCSGSTPAIASASAMTSACPSTLGAV